jgi:hypothetical protein
LPLRFRKTRDVWPWCFRAGAGTGLALASNDDDIASALATANTVFASSVSSAFESSPEPSLSLSAFESGPEPLLLLSELLLSLLVGLVVAVLVNWRLAFWAALIVLHLNSKATALVS